MLETPMRVRINWLDQNPDPQHSIKPKLISSAIKIQKNVQEKWTDI
jgi:hypothetical protein